MLSGFEVNNSLKVRSNVLESLKTPSLFLNNSAENEIPYAFLSLGKKATITLVELSSISNSKLKLMGSCVELYVAIVSSIACEKLSND